MYELFPNLTSWLTVYSLTWDSRLSQTVFFLLLLLLIKSYRKEAFQVLRISSYPPKLQIFNHPWLVLINILCVMNVTHGNKRQSWLEGVIHSLLLTPQFPQIELDLLFCSWQLIAFTLTIAVVTKLETSQGLISSKWEGA